MSEGFGLSRMIIELNEELNSKFLSFLDGFVLGTN